ncbi:MAG: DNA primase large subunit PriL [Palaeococcus sp.]|uniref:DNA primase large subunit PriL n=1 Tax=Palaeococcus sp. (in: euryarchaeotes) TaxID=2820298 RepID=UPI0025D1B002|nr:DNA primase large subunit PriL [Palaeococcus sp. (in: euryarchaeotes)]MCD6558293.1 DNA primase large subunit PriL [Palaeococcus sp. (in: euryarchaeotes)]
MIDPFGKRAREVLDEFESMDNFLRIIPGYMSIDAALERVKWIKEGRIPEYVINLDDLRDLMGFYALLGALAFSPYGLEMELVKKANLEIYRKKISKEFDVEELALPVDKVERGEIPREDEVILEKLLYEALPEEEKRKFALRYKIHLKNLLSLGSKDLNEYYIRRGYAYLTEHQLKELWESAFERNFERAVNIFYELREELPSYYLELYNRISEIAREHFKERLEKMGSASAQPLRFDLFPPCIRLALAGVGSGLRNYAITVLLTSFLSYARICPNSQGKNVRVKDCIKDLSVLEKEILPVIIEAGNRCKPPLFEDQPNEIKNIWYHLGFGYTLTPTLEDSGNSTWYFPPNCSKIKANAPELCKPDKDCRYIKNPLTYYLRKLYFARRREGNE